MAIIAVGQTKSKGTTVSYFPKHKRLFLTKEAIEELNQEGPVKYIQLLIDTEDSSKFWIQPCDKTSEKRKVFNPNIATVATYALAKILNLDYPSKVVLQAEWDRSVKALRVDLI